MKKSVATLVILAAVLVLASTTYAIAGTNTFAGAGSPNAASGTVTTTMTVNPKITMTITTPDGAGNSLLVNFGSIDPATTVNKTVDISVSSNKTYTISAVAVGSITGADTGWALNHTVPFGAGQGKGTKLYTDQYTVSPTYNLDPGNYTGTVLYTVTQ